MDQLAPLAPEDAFRLAIMRSPYGIHETAKRLGWTDSFMRRVLSIEKYFPSFEDIPKFCAAVDNIIVIEWQMARAAITVHENPNVTSDLLKSSVLDLSAELGDVAHRTRMALEDGEITKREIRGILKELLELINAAIDLAGILKAHERRVALK